MRIYLEKKLGADNFLKAYNIMNAIAEGDDEEVREGEVGEGKVRKWERERW